MANTQHDSERSQACNEKNFIFTGKSQTTINKAIHLLNPPEATAVAAAAAAGGNVCQQRVCVCTDRMGRDFLCDIMLLRNSMSRNKGKRIGKK